MRICTCTILPNYARVLPLSCCSFVGWVAGWVFYTVTSGLLDAYLQVLLCLAPFLARIASCAQLSDVLGHCRWSCGIVARHWHCHVDAVHHLHVNTSEWLSQCAAVHCPSGHGQYIKLRLPWIVLREVGVKLFWLRRYPVVNLVFSSRKPA